MSKSYSIVGMNFRNAESIVAALAVGTPVALVREPTNKYDVNAVAVWVDGKHVGYIPKKQNVVLSAFIDQTGGRPEGLAMDAALVDDTTKAITAKFFRSPNSGYPMVEVVD